jgi:drug/metabolite transporter (DMT)-like permease
MGPNPNYIAMATSVLLGVLVLFWSMTLKRITGTEFMLVLGVAYLLLGSVQYVWGAQFRPLPLTALGLAFFTAVLYAGSFLAMNYVFGHPKVNLPIATAITAAYPVVTAAVAFVVMGQRFTLRETVFFTMAVGGVVGLGLSGKQ